MLILRLKLPCRRVSRFSFPSRVFFLTSFSSSSHPTSSSIETDLRRLVSASRMSSYMRLSHPIRVVQERSNSRHSTRTPSQYRLREHDARGTVQLSHVHHRRNGQSIATGYGHGPSETLSAASSSGFGRYEKKRSIGLARVHRPRFQILVSFPV